MNANSKSLAQWWHRLDAAAAQLGGRVSWPVEKLFERDLPLQAPSLISPNKHCRLIRATDGWIAVNLAREDDRESISAWLEAEISADDYQAQDDAISVRSAAHWRDRGVLLHIPVSIVGEAKPALPALAPNPRAIERTSIAGLKVLDLSALWAGPLCGSLLAAAGANVTRLESDTRPDPTFQTTPFHAARLNGAKHTKQLAFTATNLGKEIAESDMLITSARPHALKRLSIDPASVLARNPRLLWIAITGHGWQEPSAIRVGFGDDCAAAGGLVDWHDGVPAFIGDALADPLTGLVSATIAMEALGSGLTGLLDCSLAGVAAHFADGRNSQ